MKLSKYLTVTGAIDFINLLSVMCNLTLVSLYITNTYIQTPQKYYNYIELTTSIMLLGYYAFRLYISDQFVTAFFSVSSFIDLFSLPIIIAKCVGAQISQYFNYVRVIRITACLNLD